ncbi:MAG: chitobiase/beta-hexosaminidase C-terminal domain-containing protein, partial [Gammaproteobacteria bacterium]|nr:chitobiase/beta-hexosaminidase C-terminal domain-containing protein [Gammaproteobacteria bacterium]
TSSQVNAASDDAEEDSNGTVTLNSTDLEFVQDGTKTQIVGMRFPALEIPQGATIINAFLEFHVDETSGGEIDLVIAAEVAAHASTFTTGYRNVSNRDKSVARVAWDSEVDWVSIGALQNSPDISVLVQEVISQSGWVQGNAIAMIIAGSPGDKRVADAFDGAPSGAPTLRVEYSLGAEIPIVEVPVISPAGGTYVDGVTVSISSTTVGAALHYTLDGTIPDESDGLYSVPFDLTNSALLTVKGFLSGYTASATASENFTITDSSINTAPVLAVIGDQQVNENQLMVVNVNSSDVDGTVPAFIADLTALPAGDARFIDDGNGSGQLSWTPAAGDAGDYTVTISAIDATDNALVDSEMLTISVIADPDVLPIVEAPVISPMGGVFTDSVTINMSSATPAALLYYTLDGTMPGENDSLYSVPFDLTSSTLLTVKGYLGGYTPSTTSSEDFTIIDSSINIAPVLAAIGDRQVNENQLMVVNVSASDTDGTVPGLMADLTALPVGDAGFIDNGDGSGQLSWTPAEGDAGNYAVTMSAIDALDNSLTDSEVVVIAVTVPSPVVGERVTTQRQIMNSRDDAEERGDGTINFSSSDLELVQDGMDTQVVGLRFRDLQIPRGVIITQAYLEFLVDEVNTGSIDLMIAAQATPDARSFSSNVNDISNRVKTMANVSWTNEEDWSVIGETQQSPDISPLIQEIINQGTWLNGNAVAIIISGSSNGMREADSFDGNASGAPKLVVEYRLAPFSTQGLIATKGQVSDGASDAEENGSGVVRLTSTDLELVQDGAENQMVGMRFGNMQVPQNAVITHAYLRFQADEMSTGAIDLMITAQATAHAAVFTSDSGNLSSRAITDASVNWVNEDDWSRVGDFHQSPDITTIIQEIVNQEAWANGNAMALFVTGSSSAKRVAESFEGNPQGAPVLIVEYRLVPFEANDLITRQSQISNGSDDAEENANGTVRLNSTDLELVQDGADNQVVGMRFKYLKIPQGAVITAAYLEFQVDEASSGVLDLTMAAQASANAATFTSDNGDISNRMMTGNGVVWNNEADWVNIGSTQKSPDIRLIIQEVVNLGEWISGNALAIIMMGSSAGTRVAESFEGSVSGAPRLIIEYRY